MTQPAKALSTMPHCDVPKFTVLVIISILPNKFIYSGIKFPQIFSTAAIYKAFFSLELSLDVLKKAWPLR